MLYFPLDDAENFGIVFLSLLWAGQISQIPSALQVWLEKQ
jgi:hypothetical protein